MEILLHQNRKQDPISWDASTPEKKKAALLALFNHFDEDWEYYTGMDEYLRDLGKAEMKLDALNLVELPKDHVLYADHIKKKAELEKSLPELKNGVEQYELIVKARKGDADAAERLLYLRGDYECENFDFIECADPLNL